MNVSLFRTQLNSYSITIFPAGKNTDKSVILYYIPVRDKKTDPLKNIFDFSVKKITFEVHF